jgi:hypothetical protein
MCGAASAVQERARERRVALRGLREPARDPRGHRVGRLLDDESDLGIDPAQTAACAAQLGFRDGSRVLQERVGAHRFATAGTTVLSRGAGARLGASATNWKPVNMSAIPTSSPR